MSYRWPLGSAQVGVQLSPLSDLEKLEDVAEVGFLASERARWTHGTEHACRWRVIWELLIDGGCRDPRVLNITV